MFNRTLIAMGAILLVSTACADTSSNPAPSAFQTLNSLTAGGGTPQTNAAAVISQSAKDLNHQKTKSKRSSSSPGSMANAASGFVARTSQMQTPIVTYNTGNDTSNLHQVSQDQLLEFNAAEKIKRLAIENAVLTQEVANKKLQDSLGVPEHSMRETNTLSLVGVEGFNGVYDATLELSDGTVISSVKKGDFVPGFGTVVALSRSMIKISRNGRSVVHHRSYMVNNSSSSEPRSSVQ